MTLADASCGQWLRVVGFHASTMSSYRQRLIGMGLVRGARCQVSQLAPLGGPLCLSVLGATWMLRRKEAACIEVEVE